MYGAGYHYGSSAGMSAEPAAPRPAETVRGTLDGPIGDHVLGAAPSRLVQEPAARWLGVDDVAMLLAGAPACARLALLAFALPRLADVQRLDELVAQFSEPGQRRQAQALVDASQ